MIDGALGYMEIAEITLAALLIVFAYFTIEAKNLMYAVISFICMSVVLGVIFFLLGAPYVSLFQIGVFAGATAIFFLVAVIFTRGGKWE